MGEDQPPQNFPSITRTTLNCSIEDLRSKYENADARRQFKPQALYLDQLPAYDEFFSEFLLPNQLCILSANATKQWRSRRDWVCEDGSPNFDFLKQTFGEATVPVANCKHEEFSAHPKQNMKMSEFLAYWQRYKEAGHPSGDDSFYLKDWHFTRDFPKYRAYNTCHFFQSDWLNEFWDVREDIDDDYRFVYMGPKGTWTPFHADVFRSFSWSANICGRKRWIFFPPGEEDMLKDIHGTVVYDVTSQELDDANKFPNASKAQKRIEIIQHPGETIFVPSAWHHQVENLEDTISINHNWLNGCNVHLCWAHMKASLADVEHEIWDCRDMDGWNQQCQIVLRALTGLDYNEFFQFMESIARRRLRAVEVWKERGALHMQCSLDKDQSPSDEGKTFTEQASGDKAFCSVGRSLHSDHFEVPAGSDKPGDTAFRSMGVFPQFDPPEVSVGSGNSVLTTIPIVTSSPVDGCIGFQSRKGSGTASLNTPARDDEYGVMLDLSEDVTVPSQGLGPLHWGRCDLHHALFDLASIAMVLKDMAQSPAVSMALQPEQLDLDDCELPPGEAKGRLQQPDRCKHESGMETCSHLEELANKLEKGNSGSRDHMALLIKDLSVTLSKFAVHGIWDS